MTFATAAMFTRQIAPAIQAGGCLFITSKKSAKKTL